MATDDDYDRRDDDYGDRRRGPGGGRAQRAADAVKAPAIGLIVTGVLSLVAVAINLVQYPSLDAQRDAQIAQIDANPGIPADQKQAQKDLMTTIFNGIKAVALPLYAVAAAVGALTIVAGLRLKNLRSKGLVYAGSILSMIPCTSGCCILGLPFGIWALVTLGKPEVKAAYAAQAAGAGRDVDDLDDRG